MPQISNPTGDRRSLTHAGHEVGDDNVVLRQNNADTNTPVLEWTCPRKYTRIAYAGGQHVTKFTPRTKQTVDSAGSAAPLTISLDTPIQPIAGETDIDDQMYAPVVAYNVTQDAEIHPSSYDYAVGEVTFDSGVAAGDELELWPIMVRGTTQYRGIDQFDHEIAPLDEWSEPLHVFHDFEQNNQQTKIHLVGAATWNESETLGLYIDSPDQIVWEDENFPGGQYASTIEQRVDVDV